MSDATHPSRDFLGDAEEELVFDEPEAVVTMLPIEPAAETAKPRRVPRRGRKSVEEEASPEPDAVSTITPSAGADPARAEEPAGAPAPFPPLDAAAGSKLQPWLLAIVAFAMLTSLLSLGGLIAVGRTLARANADRGQAAAQRDALAQVAPLVAHLNAASARLDAASARLPAPVAVQAVAAPPLTLADIHREIDALKLSLGQRQPEGLTSLDGMTRDGFTEMTTKLDRLSDQIAAMRKRGGAVSASPPASRAAYRARPS